MSNYIQFVRSYSPLLFFGLLLTLFSSYGQTFLISLYIPQFEQTFGLSNTGLSSLYAIATMSSAFSLPWIGRLVDTSPLRRFSILIIVGFALSLVFLSLAVHPLMILVGFFGLRFLGQGLMSHTSISTMARAFENNRGKAISVAALGHPLGEAIFPILITLLMGVWGWRWALRLSASSLLLILIPLVLILLAKQPKSLLFPPKLSAEVAKTSRNPLLLFKSKFFWIIAPTVFILGFMNTAIFFFQFKLAVARDWSPAWVAGSMAIYAGASALSLTVAGPLVDRLTARRLFRFILIPYVAGVLILAFFEHPISYPAALICIAMANGNGNTIKNALFAEVFGTEIIGTVRSLFTTVMVFSTALGPLFFGLLLDGGWSYSTIFTFSAGLLVLIVFWSWRLPTKGEV